MTRFTLLTALGLCLVSVPVAGAGQSVGFPGTIRRDLPPTPPRPAASMPATIPVWTAAPTITEYLIGPEDVIEISVWRNDELSRTVPVRPDGRISLPLLHDVQAASLTTMQLRDVLIKRFAAFIPEVEVSVIVREIRSVKISILGKVRKPGQYEIRRVTTVLEALAMAEGFDDFAQLDRIVVFRKVKDDWSRYTFDFSKTIQGSGSGNFYIQAGDILVVP